MTIDEELKLKHFEHICAQTNYFNDKLIDAFTFYVQTLSAIVGGCIYLALQEHIDKKIPTAGLLSNALVILLSTVTLVRVFGNYTAWWGARELQGTMLPSVPKPHALRSSWMEVALAVSVIAACALFVRENPFTIIKSG